MGFDFTGLGSVADFAKNIVDRFFPKQMTDEEKAMAQLKIQAMADERESALVAAQRDIIVAELSQGDNFTKRARPMIIYAGLAFIALMHVFFPIAAWFFKSEVPELSLPEEFWWAWTGVAGAWIIGRSYEKKGATGGIISAITGKK